jgi:hypothetical protein
MAMVYILDDRDDYNLGLAANEGPRKDY